MMPSKTLLFCLTLCLFSWSCQEQPAPAPDTRAADEVALRTLDTEWSKAATAKDLDRITSYLADDSVSLSPNAPAVSGKEAVRKSWSDLLALPGMALSWQIKQVEVAKSGDLGYTWGTYEMTVNDAKGNPSTDRGKYLTVWKKQANGAWKAAVDTFNSDLPAAPAK